MRKLISTISILVIFNCCLGQGYFNQWYFGNGAGLNFNNGSPSEITGQTNTMEGIAAISDFYGNLLFYTDGMKVWNANQAIMPNGTGLLGNASSTQSALIVPNPGDTNQYYIFTTLAGGGGAFTYSIVDMTLASGLGDITTVKNFTLHPTSTERATAIRIQNGSGFWIIGHEPTNNTFFSYKLTPSGIDTIPIISKIGSVHPSSAGYMGYLKPSHKGDNIAVAINGASMFEFFDFNNLSGVITNPISFPPNYPNAYGIEFSPDDSKLYISSLSNTYQINLKAGNDTSIINSSILIANDGPQGALQLGPDGKIYRAKFSTQNLSVINNPDSLGLKCNYTINQITLVSNPNGQQVQGGLPNFFEMTCSSPPSVNLGNDTSLFTGDSILLNAFVPFGTYLWQDGSTNSTYNATNSGMYWVKTSTKCGIKTDSINISYNALPLLSVELFENKNNIILFPNPFDSYINVKGTTTFQLEYIIFNLEGNEVLKGNTNDKKITNLEQLPAGQYIVYVKANGQKLNYRLIKK